MERKRSLVMSGSSGVTPLTFLSAPKLCRGSIDD